MKIRPGGAELFIGDRGTDGHNEASSRFSEFGNAAKNDEWIYQTCIYPRHEYLSKNLQTLHQPNKSKQTFNVSHNFS